MTAPAPAPMPIFVASSPFVASARRDRGSACRSYRASPVRSDVKRNAITARPFTRSESSTLVTTPVSRVPAGSTSRPSIVIGLVSSAVTVSSRALVSDATELVKANGRVVPMGIVISRYPGAGWVVETPAARSDGSGVSAASDAVVPHAPPASAAPSVRISSGFMCGACVM